MAQGGCEEGVSRVCRVYLTQAGGRYNKSLMTDPVYRGLGIYEM